MLCYWKLKSDQIDSIIMEDVLVFGVPPTGFIAQVMRSNRMAEMFV